jgi:hypothetical protein
MREIKFRVWDLEKERWVLSFVDVCITENFMSQDLFSYQQYTGLKDKNGKEIYEGDILCWPEWEGSKNQKRWVMEWIESDAGWIAYSPREAAEIIGNIYENPELL